MQMVYASSANDVNRIFLGDFKIEFNEGIERVFVWQTSSKNYRERNAISKRVGVESRERAHLPFCCYDSNTFYYALPQYQNGNILTYSFLWLYHSAVAYHI